MTPRDPGGNRQVMNTKPHPRVLVKIRDADVALRWQFLQQSTEIGLLKDVVSFNDVDPSNGMSW